MIARVAHWLWALAMLVLVMSGLQIFNAAPYLDASDKSNPARRVLAFGFVRDGGAPVGTMRVFGITVRRDTCSATRMTDKAALASRAFPGWATLPGPQDLADGRRWHLAFAWALTIALVAYLVSAGGARNAARARAAAVRSPEALADAAVLFPVAQRAAAARHL